MSDTEQPIAHPKHTHGKIKDVRKRDFLVKQLKKQREEEYWARQEQNALEDDAEQTAEVIPTAQKIVIVCDSYLDRDLSHFNKNRDIANSLPRKWNKKEHEAEFEDNNDEEEEQQAESSTQKQNKGIYDLTDDDEDDDEDDEVHSALAAKLKNIDISKYPTHEESSDDEEDYQMTRKRVVQIIEDFNEIEVIEANTAPGRTSLSQDYDDAKAIAPKAMRDKSKSPRFAARGTPKLGASLPPIVDLGSTQPLACTNNTKGGKSPYHGSKVIDKKEKDLMQQMEDLDLTLIESNSKKPISELAPLPHPDELDHVVWWKYILDHGTKIHNNRLFISVVDNFPPAHDDVPEENFHLPPGRKSAPEKPLTAFGLFKQHTLQELPQLIKASNHSKKSKSKHHADDSKLKAMFFALSDEELQDYFRLALVDKVRYKVQRTEFIYQQSTQLSLEKGRAHKDRHRD